ncbi:MAG: 16S rRNA processing protein RimM [Bacteroidales bacterium]|nr:16S rRNA processing protein RimM [Bacteroidales bacterium]
MQHSECYLLGHITKPWGTKGQLVLFLDVDTPADYADLDSAFVDIKGSLVPHFFHIDQLNGPRAVATFEDIGPDQAQLLVGRDLYLPLSLLPRLDGNRFYFHEVVGFHVVDTHWGDIGTIRQVIDYPAQPLFQIFNADTEILIPVVDPIIKQVDREAQTIHIEAPNGLIELYMGNINKGC